MKTAVIIGAGNIGRGFIGQIMSEAGYDVCFIDVSEPVVNALNERHEYPLEIVYTGGSDKKIIKMRAINTCQDIDQSSVIYGISIIK